MGILVVDDEESVDMWNERGDACFVGFKFGGSRSFLA
jgi:hypothetical protein